MSVKHAFESGKADGPDDTLVRPSDWDADHVVSSVIGARVHRTTNQTPITAQTAILFDGEDKDDLGFHSTVSNSDRLTVPSGCDGWYTIVGNVYCTGLDASAYLHVRILKNVSDINIASIRVPRSPDDNTLVTITAVAYLVAGDYVRLTVESGDSSFSVATSGTGGGGGVPSFAITRNGV